MKLLELVPISICLKTACFTMFITQDSIHSASSLIITFLHFTPRSHVETTLQARAKIPGAAQLEIKTSCPTKVINGLLWYSWQHIYILCHRSQVQIPGRDIE